MFAIKEAKAKKLENAITAELTGENLSEEELFSFADTDPSEAEKTGYSNYSYWGSTLHVFLKNKSAVFFLILLVLILLFTFIQPYLPGQYDPNIVNDDPITGMQISNHAPAFSAKAGKTVSGSEYQLLKAVSDDWYAVSNIAATIKRRTEFTVTEYSDTWLTIEYGGQTGYIFWSEDLKLPEDPTAVPYQAKSNFPVDVFSRPGDDTSSGTLYVKAAYAESDGDTVTVTADTDLYTQPSEDPFLFGTNNIGQDLWSRTWSGTRTSLFIGIIVALVEAVIGITVGVLWGYVRSLDRILTEVYNVIDNIPTTIVLILFSYIMRPGVRTLIFAMCLTGWLGMARFIRNQIIIIRDRDYNLASRCLGTGTSRIILRNCLPYLVSVIMLRMSLAIPGAIGSEVFITYIGLGLPLDTPSLGNLINEGRKLITVASLRYQLIFPAIVLSIITVSFYIIGNAFADAADPKNHV